MIRLVTMPGASWMTPLSLLSLSLLIANACSPAPSDPFQRPLQVAKAPCAQPFPASTPSNYTRAYDLEAFANRSAERLSGAVQIPTMSFDDMKTTNDARWAPFLVLHKYLEQTFPIIHSEATRVTIEKYSLLYTLKGSSPELKPLFLTGHLDVVPAITSLDRWSYSPFEGKISDGWIYGRGASDCKNNVIGILSAVEHLLESGWMPQRTILLGFGQDEEIGGHIGAFHISRLIEQTYGTNGLAMIVDEGGMDIKSLYSTEFAAVGVAEKGGINAYISVAMPGGHSSRPPAHTTIGVLARIVADIEETSLFKPVMKPESPMWEFLRCISEHGERDSVPVWIHEETSKSDPDFDTVAEKFASMSLINRHLIETSKALTVVNGGVKSNALPETARAIVNTRTEIFSTHEQIKNAYLGIAKPVAQKYSLRLNGEASNDQESIGNITFTWSPTPRNPSPISPSTISDPSWEVLSRANQATFGPDIVSTPSLLTGNTDTRHYWNLYVVFLTDPTTPWLTSRRTRNIYRWTPSRDGTRLNTHTVDEKIRVDTHVDGIRFYTEIIIGADKHPSL